MLSSKMRRYLYFSFNSIYENVVSAALPVRIEQYPYQLGQVRHHAVILKYSLRDDETPGQWPPLLLRFLIHALQHLLKALQVVVVVPSNCAARNLKALLDSEVDTSVGDDDITTL